MNLKRDHKPEMMFFFTISILCLLFVIPCSSPSFAEDYLFLSLSSTQGERNQTVSVNIDLSYSGNPLALGFQLYINYDPEVLENPSATKGQVLIDAEKEIYSDISSGVFSILVFGITQDIIQPDEEAVYIYFDIKPDAPPGQTDLTLTNLDATDPEAQDLDVLGNDGSVNVIVAVPTLSEWGLIIFMTLMMGIGVVILYRRRIV